MGSVPAVGGDKSTPLLLGSPWFACVRLLQIVVVPIILGAWAAYSPTPSLWLLFTVSLVAIALLYLRFRGGLLVSSAVLGPETVEIETLFGRNIQTIQRSKIDAATWNRAWGAVVLSVSGGRKFLVTTANRGRTRTWPDELKDGADSAVKISISWNGVFPS